MLPSTPLSADSPSRAPAPGDDLPASPGAGHRSPEPGTIHPRTRGLLRRERRVGLAFAAPWILGIFLLYLVPLGASLAFSFTNYQLVDQDDSGTRWVGLDNWTRLFDDPDVATSAWVTIRFAAIFIPISIALPLLFAYLLTAKHLWGRSIFRLLFFAPTIVPFVSGLFIWNGFLNAQDGWLNRLLGVVGIDGPDWLNDATWLTPSFGLIATWGVGNAMIIFIAALGGVPTDLYEAARIDGANSWQLFRHVTWPMISPITFYNLIIALVALGQYFLVPFALTNGTGDPDNAGLFYTMYFYRQTFTFFEAGYGATLAWAMFAVVLALTLFLFGTARYWVHYEFQERG